VFETYIKNATEKGVDGEAVFKAVQEMVQEYSKEYQ
jgi:hypothetical protein